MRCPKCQFENPDDSNFCFECGNKLEQLCPGCNVSLPIGVKFCNKCGHNLRKLQDTAPIDYEKPQSYTPKHLAEKILTTRSSLEGERKIVTVLFADVANYTSMSEILDPEEVLQIMDGAFKIMMDETHKYEGTINQFTGDGIMAIFGAPVAHENHAQRACYTALSIQSAMTDYSEKMGKEYGIDFKIRIGINSGPVIVSAIGDDLRMDYTAVGDTTNLAARMEGMAEPGTTSVSENTHKIVERYFEFNYIGKTDVKGKGEPQDKYDLLKTSDVVTRIDESVAKGLTRFVGRKNSMASIMETYDLVKSGSGQVVGVVGEAGVGKSRLIIEFRNRITHEEHTYLEGQCLQYGGSILYMPILDIIRSFFDIKDDDREHIIRKKIWEEISNNSNIEHTLPAIHDLLSLAVEDESFLKLEPKQKRERIFDAIRDILISASKERPLIVVVEDLHWIDDTSEEFIDYFIEWMANTPILLVLLYRTEYRHPWGSKTYYHKIGLDHLRKDSSIDLVKAMLKEGDVAPELRDLILSRAAGNPLFMEELTQTLIENGTIKKEANQYVLSQQVSDIQVPDTVQGIIAARMDRLEDNLKRTVQVASVIGRDFAFRILQTITGMHEELKSYLRNLQGLEFIYEKRLFPELEYIFKHALTQEVAYNSLLLKRRKHIHENIGKAIEELYFERLEEFYEMLAYHYSKSDNIEKSYQYLKLSGEKAFDNFSNQESYKYFIQAFNLLNRLPHSKENKKEKIKLFMLIFGPMALIGYPEGSFEILQNCEALSKELEEKVSLAKTYGHIGRFYAYSGKPVEGIKYIEDRFLKAQRHQDVDLMVPLSIGLELLYNPIGFLGKSTDFIVNILDILKKNGRQHENFGMPFNAYSYLCTKYSCIMSLTGEFEEARNFLTEALNYATEINDVIIIGLCELHHGTYYTSKGDGKKAIPHLKTSIEYFEKGNWQYIEGYGYGLLGYACCLIGDLKRAQKYIEKGLHIHRQTPVKYMLSSYPYYLGCVKFETGELSEAKRLSEEALKLSIDYNERGFEGWANFLLGRIFGKMSCSNSAKSEEYILTGVKIFKEIKYKPSIPLGYFCLGELYSNTGRKDESLTNLNKALSMCQEMGIKYFPDKIKEVLDRL